VKASLLFTTAVFFIATQSIAQQIEFGSNLNYIKPVGSMGRNIKDGFGITLEGAYKFTLPFTVGMELAYTGYGYQRERQQYTFDDGSVTETDVVVENSYTNLVVTGKYFLRGDKKINPYLSAKLGYSWFRTDLTIEDPEDIYSCHPLETDILAKDGTLIATGGVGLRIDFSSIFKKATEERFYFDASIHGTQGGNVKYMNVEKNHTQQTPDSDVMARFINTNTQVIHEHHVGYLYSSLMETMEFRLGVVYRVASTF